jgi:hypothetical protein
VSDDVILQSARPSRVTYEVCLAFSSNVRQCDHLVDWKCLQKLVFGVGRPFVVDNDSLAGPLWELAEHRCNGVSKNIQRL